MSKKFLIIGATGAVGHEILSILSERNFPVDAIYALASKNSEGKDVSFGNNDKIFVFNFIQRFISQKVMMI